MFSIALPTGFITIDLVVNLGNHNLETTYTKYFLYFIDNESFDQQEF